MQRIKWWLFWWLVIFFIFYDVSCQNKKGIDPGKGKRQGSCKERCNKQLNLGAQPENSGEKHGCKFAKCCMEDASNVFKNGSCEDSVNALKTLEEVLETTEVEETTCMSVGNVVALLHKHKGKFKGLEIFANDSLAISHEAASNSKVSVRLPAELDPRSNETIVFCMLNMTAATLGASNELYDNRLVGLSVRGRTISGLKEHVNITISLTTAFNENFQPSCQFYSFKTKAFSKTGCSTLRELDRITCSCDHLTYFGVLMMPNSPPSEHQEILTYITLIGCSLSLLTLFITVLIFIINRKIRSDVSIKVHINLAIALILLNLHFLPSQAVAALSSSGLCLYVALMLHYSLLATFSWMALEGFHLYLLLVRVFNIYIRKYLLKLSVVGWGLPVVIVSLVVIINRDAYGRVAMDSSNSNSTAICYITDDTVKTVTTLGVFSMVFLFNLIMFGVTIRRVMGHHQSKEFGQSDRDRAKQDVCTVLGVTTLLGITWGLVFFSFGYLTTPGLYLFCILNSLHGFFIFVWFVMSVRKIGHSAAKMSSNSSTTNS